MQDLIVIGGGPGGYLAAERAAEAGLKVSLFEQNKLGGVCLNEGCIPSKTLLNSAKVYEHAIDGKDFGVSSEKVTFDQKAVIKRKDKIVRTLVAGVNYKMKQNKVEVINERARILAKEDLAFVVQAGDQKYKAKNLIIASGSKAILPPIPGAKEGLAKNEIVTNKGILDLKEVPANLVVVGGGIIGLEMASYYNSVGSKVTVIEMLNHIGGPMEIEIAQMLQKSYEKKGIEFKLSSKVVGFESGLVRYLFEDKEETVKSDVCLLSIGRRPNTHDLGLENLQIALDRASILVDEKMQTNQPGVYAIGDVTGKWMLAHAAYREAEVAVNNILAKKDRMRYQAMPSAVYTNPEAAFVGLYSDEAKAEGYDVQEVTLPMSYSGRYLAEVKPRSEGMIKLIVDNKHKRLLGCHILSPYASEIIMVATMMIEAEMTIKEMKEYIFPHPTVCEIIREAIFQIKE